jgi:hypothetical protein
MTPEAIAQRRLMREISRNYFLRASVGSGDRPVRLGAQWLLPWAMQAYPGRGRGVAQALGVSRDVAARVLQGKASRLVTAKLAAEVRLRAMEGLAIAEALDAALAARPADKPDGLCIIDPETGLRKHQARGGRAKRRVIETPI